MNNYLSHIISSLTIKEMNLLALLYEEESDASFKAIPKKVLAKKSELSDHHLKKVMNRLEALKFIEILKFGKEHSVFITSYGKIALEKNLEGDE